MTKEKTRGLMGRYCFDYQCNWFVFWVIGIEKLVIVEEFEEMEQKIVVYATREMKNLQNNMQTQAREGWFVHEVVTQGGDSITSSMFCLVVYRKD